MNKPTTKFKIAPTIIEGKSLMEACKGLRSWIFWKNRLQNSSIVCINAKDNKTIIHALVKEFGISTGQLQRAAKVIQNENANNSASPISKQDIVAGL